MLYEQYDFDYYADTNAKFEFTKLSTRGTVSKTLSDIFDFMKYS